MHSNVNVNVLATYAKRPSNYKEHDIYIFDDTVHSACTGLLKLGKNPSLPERERDTIIV